MPQPARTDSGVKDSASLRGWRLAGVAFVFLWFFLGGIAHFVFTEAEMRIVPPVVPSPRLVVWLSGAFELAGAAGLLNRRTRRLAGLGLFMLTLAVTPAHFYMLEHPERFGIPYVALVLRLPIQIALLWLIAWSTGWIRPGGTVITAAGASRGPSAEH